MYYPRTAAVMQSYCEDVCKKELDKKRDEVASHQYPSAPGSVCTALMALSVILVTHVIMAQCPALILSMMQVNIATLWSALQH